VEGRVRGEVGYGTECDFTLPLTTCFPSSFNAQTDALFVFLLPDSPRYAPPSLSPAGQEAWCSWKP
jgi:hypothetical protein